MLLILLLPLWCSGSFVFKSYASVRDDLKFPSYTETQRVNVATQAKNLLGIYVNREAKIQHYGVDPLPVIDGILARAPKMSDEQFHFQMSALFNSLRDLHTNYFLPGPYQCYRAVFPIDFELIDSPDLVNDPIVVVKGLSSFPEVIQNMPAEIQQVSVGDVLVSYEGRSFKDFYNDHKNKTGGMLQTDVGANEYGGMRSALTYMSYVHGKVSPLPDKETVTYRLRKANSLEYSLTLPITARIDTSCLSQSPETGTEPGNFVSPSNSNDKLSFVYPGIPLTPKQQEDMMAHPYIDEIAQTISYQDYVQMSTSDSELSWSLYTSQSGIKLGIIRLESFSFVSDTLKGVLMIQQLLTAQLKDSHAVLFDVRNNGGGTISLAEGIPQLFARSRVSTTNARALNNPVNGRLFLHPDMRKDWGAAFKLAAPNDTYTPLVKFTSDEDANNVANPVGVFTNALCFSACDLFAAGMQDAGIQIFSHDAQTGGGGANVVEFNSYLAARLPAVFNRNELYALQDMRVSWRQSLRADGRRILEDAGVTADFVLRPRVEDLLPNQTVFSYLEAAAEMLFNAFNRVARTAGFQIDKIQLVLNGVVVGESLGGLEASTRILRTTLPVSVARYLEYDIVGYNGDRKIFTTYRKARSIPAESLELVQGRSIEWDFKFDNFARVYNVRTEDIEGWNTIDNGTAAAIHDGNSYANNIETSISFFVKLPTSVNPSPGCTQDFKHWRDIALQDEEFQFEEEMEQAPQDSESAEKDAWSKMPATLENSNIPLMDLLDEEEYQGVYYDLAREWIAMSLNVAVGSPASNQTFYYQTVAQRALLQFSAETMTLQDKVYDIPISTLVTALSNYNGGRSVDLYPGNPFSCTMNPFIQVDMEYDTERAKDRVYVNAKLNGAFHRQLETVSGLGRLDKFIYLDSYLEENDRVSLEIEIRFTSDDGITSKGVRINKIVFGA